MMHSEIPDHTGDMAHLLQPPSGLRLRCFTLAKFNFERCSSPSLEAAVWFDICKAASCNGKNWASEVAAGLAILAALGQDVHGFAPYFQLDL